EALRAVCVGADVFQRDWRTWLALGRVPGDGAPTTDPAVMWTSSNAQGRERRPGGRCQRPSACRQLLGSAVPPREDVRGHEVIVVRLHELDRILVWDGKCRDCRVGDERVRVVPNELGR